MNKNNTTYTFIPKKDTPKTINLFPKATAKQKYSQLNAEYPAEIIVNDYAKRSEYLDKLFDIQEEFIKNLIRHFGLSTADSTQALKYTFTISTSTIKGCTGYSTDIVNIKDVAFAFYLIKKLQQIGIDTTLIYTRSGMNNFSIESFHSRSCHFNYHASWILRTWKIEKENNVRNLTAEMYK